MLLSVPAFSSMDRLVSKKDILLTEALNLLSEQYQVLFAYDADLLRNIRVDGDLSKYQTLEASVHGLLQNSGLKYNRIGPKYCVIYKDTRKGTRSKKKLERKIRQIQNLSSNGSISLQRSTVEDESRVPVRALSRGLHDLKKQSRKLDQDPAGLKGTVVDGETGEPLIGANITIVGTSYGAATDLDGEYEIHNITAGSYTVRFSYIGYKVWDQADVQLIPGEILELNGTMSPESLLGVEVVVSAQAKGQMAAINQQRASSAITNIVASDRIKEVPDVNAAESIGRLPGVSLKRSGGEGNKIVVRGLSPQYTIVEVDGVRLSGVDGDRSVGLSVISSEMLEGIELSKSLTPDKDADAIGGVVNLRLKEAEEGFHYKVLALGGYNSLEKSFNNYKFSGSISNRFFDDKFGVLVNGGQERVIRSSDRFSASYGKNIAATPELFTSSANITEGIAVRKRTHASLMLDFKTDFMKMKFNNFYSRMVNENEFRENIFRFNSNDFRHHIASSNPMESIQSHSLRTTFNPIKTELNVDLTYSITKLDSDRDQYNFEDNHVLGGSSISENQKLFAQPSSLIDQFFDISSGRKSLLLDNVRSTSIRDDITKTVHLSWKVPFRFFEDVSGYLKIGGKYARKDRSNDTESKQAYYWGGIGIGRVSQLVYPAYPDFLTREDVGISNAEGVVGANFIDPDYDYGEILDGRYDLGWSADLAKLKSVHDNLYEMHGSTIQWDQGVQSNNNDFTNTEELTAGYIMTEINLGKKIMLLPGVRYERMQTNYAARYLLEDPFDPDGLKWARDVSANRENTHWFPSINMKIDLNEWSDIRAAAYKSASRPDYRFLSPGITANGDRTNLTSYNPFLKPSLADNYDLGISFFTNKLGLFTVNGFYKEIEDLIYRLPVYQPEYFDRLEGAPNSLVESLRAPRVLYDDELYKESGTKNNNIPINNPNTAFFRGFEISWQTNFWYLPGVLRGLVLDLNYSRIWSKTQFPYLDIVTTFDDSGIIPIPVETPQYATREARMLDQPTTLFNARIGWDLGGFSSRLSFRYQGSTIRRLDPVHSLLDEVTGDVFRIDFALKQKIAKNFSFLMDLANINEFIDDANLHALEFVMPTSSEFYGFTAQFGFRYEF